MPTSAKELLAAANAAVSKITPDETAKLMKEQNALVVDVRDSAEIQASGKVKGAVHIPRGMLEFKADPESAYYDKAFSKDRPIVFYCASGGRSALSAKLLKDYGYENVHNLGGFQGWVDAGGEVDKG